MSMGYARLVFKYIVYFFAGGLTILSLGIILRCSFRLSLFLRERMEVTNKETFMYFGYTFLSLPQTSGDNC